MDKYEIISVIVGFIVLPFTLRFGYTIIRDNFTMEGLVNVLRNWFKGFIILIILSAIIGFIVFSIGVIEQQY